MKKRILFLFSIAILVGQMQWHAAIAQLSTPDPGSYDGSWWNRAPVRLIQTNLREIDVEVDVDTYVQSIVDASANVVLLNVGGIVANYPTRLPFHYLNPLMSGDFVGSVVEKLHQRGIKVIARFDFSKINESIAAQKPDWRYIGSHGNQVNYNGQVHACINGGYQQAYVFEILREAITAYPFDGIFFNAIGYGTTDYSGNYHGICQCGNCKKRFQDSTGHELPRSTDGDSKILAEYRDFQRVTSNELFQKVADYIKGLDSSLIITTYTATGVEMVRRESESRLTPDFEWNYASTDHVKRDLGSYTEKSVSNATDHFVAMWFRHAAVSPNLSRIRTLENMLHGAPLDFYCIGTLLNQFDRAYLPVLNDLYGFHKMNEKLFTNVQSVAKVALVTGEREEFRGLIKLLSEEHIMFDVIVPSAIADDNAPRKLAEYDAVILGNVSNRDRRFVDRLDNFVANGGKLLVTGASTTTYDGSGKPRVGFGLASLGVDSDYEVFPQSKSTYLNISEADKALLGADEFEALDLMMVYTDFLKCTPKPNATGYFNLIPATMFGPPEKCYFTEEEITGVAGLFHYPYGKGETVFIPWQLGAQYLFKANPAHRKLFTAALTNLLNIDRTIQTNASSLLEITHLYNRNGAFEWLGFINHSGQIGASFLDPVPINDTEISFRPMKPVKDIHCLRSGRSVPFKEHDGLVTCVIPQVADFEMVVCRYQ